MKAGVLLFNLGGPETLADVKPFLYRLLSDVFESLDVRFPKLLAYTIATLRRKTSEGYYSQIGGGSPLRRLTEEQGRALAEELRRRGRNVETFVGMCAAPPFLQDALEKMEDRHFDNIVILPLFPQYSVTTTGAGFSTLRRLIARRPAFKKINVHWVSSWADQPTYIESFVQSVQRELEKFSNPERVHLLFSAHGVPESCIQKGDPYLEQTKKSVELIMDRLSRQNPHQLSFQSKLGRAKWLEPSTNDVLVELGKKGVDDVLIVPISFVSEHIETLYELDILYKKVATEAGVANFRRVPALNNDPTFIRALAEIVESAL